MHLLLQSVPIEMNGLVRYGKMWSRLAASGRFVCGRSAIWVEEMMALLGKVMGMGWFALVLLKNRGVSGDLVSVSAVVRYSQN